METQLAHFELNSDSRRRLFLDLSLTALSNVYDVREFGAKGDGITDDTAAIAAAIEAIPQTGGALYFPSGTYKCNINLQTRDNITVYGNGPSSVIKWSSGFGMNVNYCENLNVHDLAFRHGETAFSIYGARNAHFYNLYIHSLSGDGIYINADGAMELYFDNVILEDVANTALKLRASTTEDHGGIYLHNVTALRTMQGTKAFDFECTNANEGQLYLEADFITANNYDDIGLRICNMQRSNVSRSFFAGAKPGAGMVQITGGYNHMLRGVEIINTSPTGSALELVGNARQIMLSDVAFGNGAAHAIKCGALSGSPVLLGNYLNFCTDLTDSEAKLFTGSGGRVTGAQIIKTRGSGGSGDAIRIDDADNGGSKYIVNRFGGLEFVDGTFEKTVLLVADDGIKVMGGSGKIKGYFTGSKPFDFPLVAHGAVVSTTVSVTGATMGDIVQASVNVTLSAGAFLTAAVTVADVVTVTLVNMSGGSLELDPAMLSVLVTRFSA